jgi:hypothetical protein
MKEMLKMLNQKPIAYYPIYRQITGSTTAGILLSQLMYWFSKKDKIYKTDKEIRQETLLTERELKTAKSKIKSLPFIKVTLEGVPAKTYYEIDWETYWNALKQFCSENEDDNVQTTLDKSSELNGTNRPNKKGQIVRTITENTTENTNRDNINNNNKDGENFKSENGTGKQKKELPSKLKEFLKKANLKVKMNDFNNLMKKENYAEEVIKRFYDYRLEMDKPINTSTELVKFLDDLIRLKMKGIEPEKAIETTFGSGWKKISLQGVLKAIQDENELNNTSIQKQDNEGLKAVKEALGTDLNADLIYDIMKNGI